MASDVGSPRREQTPSGAATTIPQKRALEDDHSPAVPSPLNPENKAAPKVQIQAPEETQQAAVLNREKRTKKDSFKKREAKAAAGGSDSSRATPDPKQQHKEPSINELLPARYKLAPPKLTDFEPARGPVFNSHHEVQGPEGETIEFFDATEHVFNKRAFHYTHCIADPTFPSMFYYRQTETEPYAAHMAFEDSASHVYFDRQGRHVTTDKGFRMSRANVAVREGRWYWECKVTRGTLREPGSEADTKAHGHVRLGWARREASLDAPVGFDCYSYGIRDVEGQKVHMSRPKDFFPPGEEIKEGDVIGLEIQLPSEHLHRKIVTGHYNPAVDLADDEPSLEAPNIIRDRIPIRFKQHIYFEKIDYHTTKELEDLFSPAPVTSAGSNSPEQPNPNHPLPSLRTLPNSYIKIYKNGKDMGTPWTDLFAFLPPASKQSTQSGAHAGREALDDGTVGYYPAVSVFRGGAVEVNFGPDFWFPPPGSGLPQKQQNGVGGDEDDVDMLDDGSVLNQKPLCPVSDRYEEQIVEDIVYDIIDEVGFWAQDGGKVIDRFNFTAKDAEKLLATGGGGAQLLPGGREEIKELVQDD
ncbi:hypothetical protein SMACR_07055 [Sordaria macrospora]|uniref:WGS project CABT00000000 data, contig 2.36 n=2 Tax=Sordaria macrospora TaxID=5147 RepID=F7W6Y6_SORMK|nr:uncharacterized protein SMAC_07055 [Sordaria macrospora k-hell]KAA8622161.1 hypothetical protein SMACR_07055 [Sordaria macrospora]WPJ61734.1 hypothetical protein SMAC4_07055 [Sordaria macrospora]CCC13276.1 unnamed protein product [Sordaria macrospora k-hell]